MLKLTEHTLKEIQAHGSASYPHEGCGLLLGRAEYGENVAVAIFPVPNRWENEEEKSYRFLIHDQDMLQVELAAAAQDLDVIGIFHSHPDHPPDASLRDLAWAAWSGYSYLITEVRQGQPGRSRSWQLLIDRSGFKEETVEIGDFANSAS
jgi:proteasome lid subunit RPN8/RPN11